MHPSLPRLREQFRTLEYTTAAVRRLLGLAESDETILSNVARYSLYHLSDLELHRTPCALLARLFLLSGTVTPYELNILPADLVDLLDQLELIGPAHDQRLISGTVSITEYSGQYFLSDQLFANRGDDLIVHDAAPLCMPPHASSFELLRGLGAPAPGSSFLDVGCGTGCLSILSADGDARVSGFDASERCVLFARQNARLNGLPGRYAVGRWETFTGDGDRFDHVAMNPPDPESAFGFLTTRAAELLADDGTAQVHVICEVLGSDAGPAGLVERRLGAGSGLAVTVTINEGSPLSLSAADIRARRLPPGSLLVTSPAHADRYLAGLAERGVTEVVSTIVTARRAPVST